MAKSTTASRAGLALAGALLSFCVPRAAASAPQGKLEMCLGAKPDPPGIQVVCDPHQSAPLPPDACESPQPHSWRPRCPLRTLPVLAAENGLAKASLVVAFKDYPELTNANYQALTAQVDNTATTQELCDKAKGQWVPAEGDDESQCWVRPRVRVEPPTLCEDTQDWCCSKHPDAIWKGQGLGPNAGCMVPSYVYHRGLSKEENLRLGDPLLDKPAHLRSYGFVQGELPRACKDDPVGCGKLELGFPGPILLLRKGSEPKTDGLLPNDGDRLELSLYNLMKSDDIPDDTCNPVNQPRLRNDVYPACFHGDDVTNLHFHGSHVSPQRHQDDVLVNVKPFDSRDHGGHDPDSVFVGQYDIALDPITWRQSEGTHWYHPHKHGSTALQVLNGMAGALIVKGPFDDWIEEKAFGAAHDQYRNSLAPQDKVMVVQAIADEINLSARFDRWNTPWAMVNGQFQPIVRMQPGEIQRWRIIGATQDASAHLELFLGTGSGLEVRQIAQDGVPFSPASYAGSAACDPDDFWQLAPGNRIDLLVRASTDPAMVGKPLMVMQRPSSDLPPQALHRFIGDSTAVFPLFYVEICNPQTDDRCSVKTTPLPAGLPPLPDYLSDVEDSKIVRRRTITFDQTADPAGASRDGSPAEKTVANFRIDGNPYDPGCFNQTMTIGTAEEWRIVNNTVMNHPLHIHVNPFQVTRMKYAKLVDAPRNRYQMVSERFAHPVWRDTIALPTVETPSCIDGSGNVVARILDSQTCLEQGFVPPRRDDDDSLLPIGSIPGEITLRQRFDDWSGPYVLHCHILGHEDRGMMQNLQTTCPNGQYGVPANYALDAKGHFKSLVKPLPDERQRECSDGKYISPPGPLCAPTAPLKLPISRP